MEDDEDEELDMKFIMNKSKVSDTNGNKGKISDPETNTNDAVFNDINESDINESDVDESDIDESDISESDISESENKRLDPEMLALATRMKKSKKEKEKIIDSLWTRHCRGEEDLPEWFVEDEKKATIRILPVTKEQVDQYRQEQKILEAQPRKKVLEARQRRKYKVEKLIEKARAKSEKLDTMDDEVEMNQDKIDHVKRIYKKAAKELNQKKEKKYIVAKRHLVNGRRYTKPKSIKGPYKVVDAREKKDKKVQKTGKKVRRKVHKKRR